MADDLCCASGGPVHCDVADQSSYTQASALEAHSIQGEALLAGHTPAEGHNSREPQHTPAAVHNPVVVQGGSAKCSEVH